jgi:hypothetical protein
MYRQIACEVMFESDADETSLTTLLLDSLKKVRNLTISGHCFHLLDLGHELNNCVWNYTCRFLKCTLCCDVVVRNGHTKDSSRKHCGYWWDGNADGLQT